MVAPETARAKYSGGFIPTVDLFMFFLYNALENHETNRNLLIVKERMLWIYI